MQQNPDFGVVRLDKVCYFGDVMNLAHSDLIRRPRRVRRLVSLGGPA